MPRRSRPSRPDTKQQPHKPPSISTATANESIDLTIPLRAFTLRHYDQLLKISSDGYGRVGKGTLVAMFPSEDTALQFLENYLNPMNIVIAPNKQKEILATVHYIPWSKSSKSMFVDLFNLGSFDDDGVNYQVNFVFIVGYKASQIDPRFIMTIGSHMESDGIIGNSDVVQTSVKESIDQMGSLRKMAEQENPELLKAFTLITEMEKQRGVKVNQDVFDLKKVKELLDGMTKTVGPCSECKKSDASMVCATCGILYCDRLCQKKNWATHKKFCSTGAYFKKRMKMHYLELLTKTATADKKAVDDEPKKTEPKKTEQKKTEPTRHEINKQAKKQAKRQALKQEQQKKVEATAEDIPKLLQLPDESSVDKLIAWLRHQMGEMECQKVLDWMTLVLKRPHVHAGLNLMMHGEYPETLIDFFKKIFVPIALRHDEVMLIKTLDDLSRAQQQESEREKREKVGGKKAGQKVYMFIIYCPVTYFMDHLRVPFDDWRDSMDHDTNAIALLSGKLDLTKYE